MYRDAAASKPNCPAGLLGALGEALGGERVEPEDLAAYLFALLSTPSYRERFADEFADKEVRVPLTADAALFAEVVGLGRKMLWLHTRGQRLGEGRSAFPECDVILIEPVGEIPESLADIEYDEAEHLLWIGDGCIAGVSAEVWNYSVSGWQVLRHWLGHRTARGRPEPGGAADSTTSAPIAGMMPGRTSCSISSASSLVRSNCSRTRTLSWIASLPAS